MGWREREEKGAAEEEEERRTWRPAREDREVGFFLSFWSPWSAPFPISRPFAPFPAWLPPTTMFSHWLVLVPSPILKRPTKRTSLANKFFR
jgi:hypothetical protein